MVLDTIAPVVTVNLNSTSDRTPELTGTVDDTAATIQVTVDGSTLLGEPLTMRLIVSLILVSIGIYIVNRQ